MNDRKRLDLRLTNNPGKAAKGRKGLYFNSDGVLKQIDALGASEPEQIGWFSLVGANVATYSDINTLFETTVGRLPVSDAVFLKDTGVPASFVLWHDADVPEWRGFNLTGDNLVVVDGSGA